MLRRRLAKQLKAAIQWVLPGFDIALTLATHLCVTIVSGLRNRPLEKQWQMVDCHHGCSDIELPTLHLQSKDGVPETIGSHVECIVFLAPRPTPRQVSLSGMNMSLNKRAKGSSHHLI